MIKNSRWKIHEDEIRFENRNLTIFVMDNTFFFKNYICFLRFIKNTSIKFYISKNLKNICIEYKDKFQMI